MTTATTIREIRRARKLRQADLAERAGYSAGHVANLELGRRNVTSRNRARLAAALGIAPEELSSP